MKICALLSFYDERPEDLQRMAASLPKAGVDHLVALDGAYALYPDGKPASSHESRRALAAALNQAGITHNIVVPDTVWHGNETEKRTRLFRLGDEHTAPADWFLIIDGDEVITQAPSDLRQQLEYSPMDVGEVTFSEPRPRRKTRSFPIPILFRAVRGIEVVKNHFTYRTPDGRYLWGNAVTQRLQARLPLHDLVVEHRKYMRLPDRRKAAVGYYERRDRDNTEVGLCDRCRKQWAQTTLHTNWRETTPGRFVGDWLEVCAGCAPGVHAQNAAWFAERGLPYEPDRVQPSPDPVAA